MLCASDGVSPGLKLTTTNSNSLPASNDSVCRAATDAVQHKGAEHRTVVIGQHEHHRPGAEEIAEHDVAALLVDKRRVQGQLPVQVLIDADVLKDRQPFGGRLAGRRHVDRRA